MEANVVMLEPIKKSRISDEVVERLCELIVSGEYPAGRKLPPERELAGQLAITRSSLREALRMMEGMGLITVRPGDGIYVEDFRENAELDFVKLMLSTGIGVDAELVNCIGEVRRLLTMPLLELAAERIDENAVAELDAMIAEFPDRVTRELLAGDWDFRFFHAIAKATGNPIFVYMLNTVRDMFGLLKWFYPMVEGSLEQVLAIDRGIVDALREHDPGKALAFERKRIELLGSQFLESDKKSGKDRSPRRAASD
jgi:GntR family transcriptional repressor for pyruvate dehydrogenase complex